MVLDVGESRLSDAEWTAQMRTHEREMRKVLRQLYRSNGLAERPKTLARLPELDDLDVPELLPGDEIPTRAPDDSGYGLRYYDPYGRPLTGDDTAQSMAFAFYRIQQGMNYTSRCFFRGGVKLWVSTSYLGYDMLGFLTDGQGPPLVWETLVFAGSFRAVGRWRYGNPGAARHGHAMVVQAIASEQRRRRALVPFIAPRRGLGGPVPRPW